MGTLDLLLVSLFFMVFFIILCRCLYLFGSVLPLNKEYHTETYNVNGINFDSLQNRFRFVVVYVGWLNLPVT